MKPSKQRNLPKYLMKAITSPTASSGEYARLGSEEWLELARHIYDDETVIRGGWSRPFLPRGRLNEAQRRGIRTTLDHLLLEAVVEHQGAAGVIPQYQRVAETLRALYPQVSISPDFFNYEDKSAVVE